MIKILWSIVVVGLGLMVMATNVKADNWDFPAPDPFLTFEQCIVYHQNSIRDINMFCFDFPRSK